MAKTLASVDAISGKEGRAYAKIDGNNEELFMAKSVKATVEKAKDVYKRQRTRWERVIPSRSA